MGIVFSRFKGCLLKKLGTRKKCVDKSFRCMYN